jgi:hypothetical protein
MIRDRQAGVGAQPTPSTLSDYSELSMFQIIVRGIKQRSADGRVVEDTDPFKAFDTALTIADYTEREPLIEWQDKAALAVLDVDYHGTKPPEHPRFVVDRIFPRPARWWVSHGGGLKLVYAATGGLNAEECACIARHILRSLGTGESGIEIQTTTRHPKYPRIDQRCGPVNQYIVADLNKARGVLLGDIDQDAELDPEVIDEWLAENGWERGQRYAHDLCPIEPTGTGEREPVVVLEAGICCHVCAQKGNTYAGMSKPGFAPWRLLIGSEPARVRNDLRAAIRHVCHWEHAKHIIDDEGAYRALLRLWHVVGATDDVKVAVEARLRKAFFPALPIVRGRGVWLDSKTFAPASRDGLEKLLEALPAVRYIDEKGKEKVCRALVGRFQGSYDLTEYGYASITPLRGVDIGRRDRDPMCTDRTVYAVAQSEPPFRYRDAAKRAKIDPEKTLRGCFPGVDLNLLRLLIAAKGRIQSGAYQNAPQLFITGQSGAGKSVHVLLAAQLCCDAAEIINVEQTSVERLLQQYGSASERSGFVLFNEADKSKLSDKDMRNLVLHFEKGKGYHAMYAGRRTIDTPAVVAYTGQMMPELLRRDAQTARRIIHVNLGAGILSDPVDWHLTCGSGSVTEWRRQLFLNHDAADAFVSEVMDRFFGKQMRWESVVAELGFSMLAGEASDDREQYRHLFDLACAGTGEDHSRWKRDLGWVVFNVESRTLPLAVLYRDLTTSETGGEDKASLIAANWGDIVGVPGVECEAKAHGTWRAIRFRHGKQRAGIAQYNGDLLAGSREPTASIAPAECQPDWQTDLFSGIGVTSD